MSATMTLLFNPLAADSPAYIAKEIVDWPHYNKDPDGRRYSARHGGGGT